MWLFFLIKVKGGKSSRNKEEHTCPPSVVGIPIKGLEGGEVRENTKHTAACCFGWESLAKDDFFCHDFTLKIKFIQAAQLFNSDRVEQRSEKERRWLECCLKHLSESERVVTKPGPYPTVILSFYIRNQTETDTVFSWSAEFVSRSYCCYGYSLFTVVARMLFSVQSANDLQKTLLYIELYCM